MSNESWWNAYRFPTDAEISRGREEHDVYWVGASLDRAEARALLRHTGGQLQFGDGGEVENCEVQS